MTVKIDLKEDAAKVRAMLFDNVAKYVKLHRDPKTAGEHRPVSRIDLWFWLYDGGLSPPFVLLHLDTRPESEPDGTWSHESFAEVKLPRWRRSIEKMIEGEMVEFVMRDGSVRKGDADQIESVFGEFLVDVLKSARADGVFKILPKSAGCELGVESDDGEFGWPVYEERGRENLAEELKAGKR